VNTQKRLYRSTTDSHVAGVCGGIAEYLEVDPTLVRLAFVALTLMGGPGLIIYIILWLVVPEAPEGNACPSRERGLLRGRGPLEIPTAPATTRNLNPGARRATPQSFLLNEVGRLAVRFLFRRGHAGALFSCGQRVVGIWRIAAAFS